MKNIFNALSKSASYVDQRKITYDFSHTGYSVINFKYYNNFYKTIDQGCNSQHKKIIRTIWPKYLMSVNGIVEKENIENAVRSYESLNEDHFSLGRRYRAYSRYKWSTKDDVASLDSSNEYFQTKNYNHMDGGKVRVFSKISDSFLHNPLLQTFLTLDIGIASTLDSLTFDDSLEIGLHQIRYKANSTQCAYSTPAWLHKDEEPVVFIHVFNYSSNMVGGDNIIAKNGSEILRSLKLEPLQTMLLSKNVLHAVTPMSSMDENYAVRDILVVTFKNNKPVFTLDSNDQNIVNKNNSQEIKRNFNLQLNQTNKFSSFFWKKCESASELNVKYLPAI